MNAEEYLDRLLVNYAGTYNIYVPYRIYDRIYNAYGFYESHLEKYMLTRYTNLWLQDSYEHCLFLTVSEVTKELIDEMKETIVSYVEPVLVLKGKKVPEPNHMYSYMSVILICDRKPEKDTVRYLKKQKYEHSYRMSVRGFSQAHFCLVSTEDEKIYTNSVAAGKKKLLKKVLKEVHEGKTGFKELADRGELAPFHQEL